MTSFTDLKIIIENPRGTSKMFRRKSSGDPAWKVYPLNGVTYPVDYGYIDGYQSEDNMGLDVFLGTGDLFGYFKMWKVDVPEETKFFAKVTEQELETILKAFAPVILMSKRISESELMAELDQFKI